MGRTCVGAGMTTLDIVHNGSGRLDVYAGGSCTNVLTILSWLGWRAVNIARLGADPEGKAVIADMSRWGVVTDHISMEKGIETPRIIENLNPDGKHSFSLKCRHGKWLPWHRPFLLRKVGRVFDVVGVPDVFYFDMATPAALEMARRFGEMGSVVMFEPQRIRNKRIFAECLKATDILKHCRRQAERDADHGVVPPLEIQTMGADGLRYRAGFLNGGWRHIGAVKAADVVDAAGSGDCLAAGFIHMVGRPWDSTRQEIEKALRFGQALAAVNCGFAGPRGAMYGMSADWLLSHVREAIKTGKAPRIENRRYVIRPMSGFDECACAPDAGKRPRAPATQVGTGSHG